MITRAMLPGDRRFIVPTWVRSLAFQRRGDHRARTLKRYWSIVDRVLDDRATRVEVLTAGSAIHAWAAVTGDVLQYAYVPPELRGHGLARRCITAALGGYPDVIPVTHAWPFAGERFVLTPHHLLRIAS